MRTGLTSRGEVWRGKIRERGHVYARRGIKEYTEGTVLDYAFNYWFANTMQTKAS